MCFRARNDDVELEKGLERQNNINIILSYTITSLFYSCLLVQQLYITVSNWRSNVSESWWWMIPRSFRIFGTSQCIATSARSGEPFCIGQAPDHYRRDSPGCHVAKMLPVKSQQRLVRWRFELKPWITMPGGANMWKQLKTWPSVFLIPKWCDWKPMSSPWSRRGQPLKNP